MLVCFMIIFQEFFSPQYEASLIVKSNLWHYAESPFSRLYKIFISISFIILTIQTGQLQKPYLPIGSLPALFPHGV